MILVAGYNTSGTSCVSSINHWNCLWKGYSIAMGYGLHGITSFMAVVRFDFALFGCRTIGSAAKLLSEELYTKPTHFILELVQNADDCLYEDDTQPELQFDLFEDALFLSSNELGFNEANVRAICNLGGSTKVGTSTPATGRFTGEKGEQ